MLNFSLGRSYAGTPTYPIHRRGLSSALLAAAAKQVGIRFSCLIFHFSLISSVSDRLPSSVTGRDSCLAARISSGVYYVCSFHSSSFYPILRLLVALVRQFPAAGCLSKRTKTLCASIIGWRECSAKQMRGVRMHPRDASSRCIPLACIALPMHSLADTFSLPIFQYFNFIIFAVSPLIWRIRKIEQGNCAANRKFLLATADLDSSQYRPQIIVCGRGRNLIVETSSHFIAVHCRPSEELRDARSFDYLS